MVLEIVSIVISVTAVYFTYRGLKKSREHNRKSVQPYLVHSSDYDDNKIFTITISNKGLGTAILDKVIFKIEGKEIEASNKYRFERELHNSIYEFFSSVEKPEVKFQYNKISNDYALKAGEDFELIQFRIIGMNSFYNTSLFLNRIEMECDYSSIYGEKDTLHFNLLEGESLEQYDII